MEHGGALRHLEQLGVVTVDGSGLDLLLGPVDDEPELALQNLVQRAAEQVMGE